ncbi:MAG: alanine--tRNA ligase [Christensenellaceae bacterium]|jgi:alanyl-tRNA synthetase|nr:alanine--tRNA ligase [Christensenellaceae bacterium]
MAMVSYKELRAMWLDFYKSKGHIEIPSAPVVPENDGSTLFINSGMHPLVPYLMGEKHPQGKRLTDIQKCIRTGDIEEVGDKSHLTFFEMMGNWSLGDYFKKEKVAWSFEFLTTVLKIPAERIAVSCFEGDEVAPRDEECAKYWREVGIPDERIFFLPKSENWWQLPSGTGPCGPDSEMFYDTGAAACGKGCNPSCDCGKYVEIGNDVYMQYKIENAGEKAIPLAQKNVDTGMGLERILCFINGLSSVYETELFTPAIEIIAKNSGVKYDINGENAFLFHIIVEHTRASTIIISDGVAPSPTGQGYVLRRLIRRASRMANKLGMPKETFINIIDFYISKHGEFYANLTHKRDQIIAIFMEEIEKFDACLTQGLKEFEKVLPYVKDNTLNGKTAFRLYETYGFPIEITAELAKEQGLAVDMAAYEEAKRKHAELSQTASAGSFKGGLADTSDASTNLHTATHLLLAGLKKLLGEGVHQRGSNITPERLRFDFNCDHKLTEAEIKFLEDFVNDAIRREIPITFEEMTIEKAREIGAEGSFANKYGEIVKVYKIGDLSLEMCGGPHAKNTADLKSFKITKEEASSSGVRRIKAIIGK